ncbi:hypothetical protein BDV95DRAFT_110539 [Massariosphaeria phaeospora]|uniref:Chitin-binding type-1 domain-containing protein n=1 Tax=Massariosphaeria phaeospora TaxID=100035 RepID=A0A7C8MGR9_9PLEO|nr:hypothetical protein BDV95DRAFT_110539 [Massariosphaeria phaeospora]
MRSVFLLAIAALTLANALATDKTARCGTEFGITCHGSDFGSCCSQLGFCGSTLTHCETGCQPEYGACSSSRQASPPVLATKSVSPLVWRASPMSLAKASPTSPIVEPVAASSLSGPNVARADLSVRDTADASAQRNCNHNALHNPSFNTGSLAPWISFVTGAWQQRQVRPLPNNPSQHYFSAHTSSVAFASLTLSQTDVSVPDGTLVDCSALVQAHRSGSGQGNFVTRFDVFIGDVSCGIGTVVNGATGWFRVGGRVRVVGDTHVAVVVVTSDKAGEHGASIGVRDVQVKTVGDC